MNTQTRNTAKQTYIAPQIDRIRMDYEISLALESVTTPPTGPNEIVAPGFESFNNDPLKSNMG